MRVKEKRSKGRLSIYGTPAIRFRLILRAIRHRHSSSGRTIALHHIAGQFWHYSKAMRSALWECIRAVNDDGRFGRWHPEPAISKHPDDIPQILANIATKSVDTSDTWIK